MGVRTLRSKFSKSTIEKLLTLHRQPTVKNAAGETCAGVRIVECWWIISAMTVEVLADADTDVIIMHLTEGQSGYQDFSKFGGLPKSQSFGTNGTGDIKFTTTGAGAAGDAYQIIIRAIKEY